MYAADTSLLRTNAKRSRMQFGFHSDGELERVHTRAREVQCVFSFFVF